MTFEYNCNYAPWKNATHAKNGMVATSEPQAAQAAQAILKNGGNAMDAALAAAACMTVTEPTGCGIGGDAFAIVWWRGKDGAKPALYGINGSGPAPAALDRATVRKLGHEAMPKHGWLPVTVPGTPATWAALAERFGSRPLAELMAPAARLAREGFAVSPVVSLQWQRCEEEYRETLPPELLRSWLDTFTCDGHAPRAGEIFANEAMAQTLEEIGRTNAKSFYSGALAQKIVQFAAATGGLLSADDLAAFSPEWVDPLSVRYRGVDVWELPPNGQGMVALKALSIMNGFDVPAVMDEVTLHRQCEALKLAFEEGYTEITDSRFMRSRIDDLLSEASSSRLRAQIGDMARMPLKNTPKASGTIYLCTADSDGNMVSFIQSNYKGFGSGVVVPDTGIALQNRGWDFSLDTDDVNVLEPGKRPFHTIIPGFISLDGEALGPFGLMGGKMQPQGHMQLLMNLIDFDLNPQEALDAPRWRWDGDKVLSVESDFPERLVQALIRRGHAVRIDPDPTTFGRGQIILRNKTTGGLVGATERRADGLVLGI